MAIIDFAKAAGSGWNMTTIVATLSVLSVIYVGLTIIYRIYFHPLAKYPGPLLGKFTSLMPVIAMARMHRITWQTEMLRKYGSPVRIGTNELIFGDAAGWHDIYGQGSNICTKEPTFYQGLTVNGGTSILTETDRVRHARLRRLLSHVFSQSQLLQEEHIVQERADMFLDMIIAPAARAGVSVDIHDKVSEHYLDVVSKLCLGRSFNSVSGNGLMTHYDLDQFMVVVPIQSFFPFLRYFPLKYIQDGFAGLQRLIDFSKASVQTFSRELDQDPAYGKGSFLRNLLDAEDAETGTKLGLGELVENTVIFLVAGADTTAVITMYTLWECAKKPEVRDKLVKEIRTAFPDPKERPSFEKASQLPYLDAVLQETLRKWAPLSAAFPRICPGREIAGHYIPKGTLVSTSGRASATDPAVFVEPAEYIPERWLAPTKEMKEASKPFGYGPRNCIGRHLAQITLVLTIARLLQLYDFENDPKMTDEVMRSKDRGTAGPWGMEYLLRPKAVYA